jgi:hypothetical protein
MGDGRWSIEQLRRNVVVWLVGSLVGWVTGQLTGLGLLGWLVGCSYELVFRIVGALVRLVVGGWAGVFRFWQLGSFKV